MPLPLQPNSAINGEAPLFRPPGATRAVSGRRMSQMAFLHVGRVERPGTDDGQSALPAFGAMPT
jgi:hypothetical protein